MTASRGEFELIEWIRKRVGHSPQVPIGIGDDAAVIAFHPPGQSLVTVDMLMEGTHFTLEMATPFQIGWKSLGVNLSDIAAMGGQAIAAVVSIALPRSRAWELAQGIQAGLDRLAEQFGVCIAGGDTNTWDGPLVVSITALGEPHARGPVLRSGALSGDAIMVTGELGGSLAGRHLDFMPRLNEAKWLMDHAPIHSMIDISDGLAADLHHILEESRVGARLFADLIPLSMAARHQPDDRSALDHAISDGEDFELLFTISPLDIERILREWPFEVKLSKIGEIVSEQNCVLVDSNGVSQALAARGWRHGFH